MSNLSVLLIGFGGPESPAQVRPFIESVAAGHGIPAARLQEVARRYERIGGVSPYNAAVRAFAGRLEKRIDKSLGERSRVFYAFRHAMPDLRTAFHAMKSSGVELAAGFVLSPFRSEPSYERYVEAAESARKEAGEEHIRIIYTEPFYSDDQFVRAWVGAARTALDGDEASFEDGSTYVLFCAHSIPRAAAERSHYTEQFESAARLVAQKLRARSWSLAYQSRSGRPSEPWLSPDVAESARCLEPGRVRTVAVVPIGFLCENAEVLYDLDVTARAAVEKRGMHYVRAGAVLGDPALAEMVADLARAVVK